MFALKGRTSSRDRAGWRRPLPRAIAVLLISAGLAYLSAYNANAASRVCNANTISALENSTTPIAIGCSITLEPNAVIHAPIVFSGGAASQSSIDCRGGTIKSDASDQVAVTIASVHQSDGGWDAPKHISVRNCIIEGAIRVIGMGENGEAEPVRQSSLSVGHTERAQAAAPSDIMLSALRITTKGTIPRYTGPETTKLTVTDSTFLGQSGSVGIYLDAESADNAIRNNHSNCKRRVVK